MKTTKNTPIKTLKLNIQGKNKDNSNTKDEHEMITTARLQD